MKLTCGLLTAPDKTVAPDLAERARSLTISWLRWSYIGDIIEGATVDEILDRCSESGADYCFIQSPGHIVREQWSPKQEESLEFFHTLRNWIEKEDFLVCGQVIQGPGLGAGLLNRWLLVNLGHYRSAGAPRFAGDLQGARLLQASLDRGLPVCGLESIMSRLALDLGADLSEHPEFLPGLEAQSERASRGIFPWNFESYSDVIEPPTGWNGPLSALYSVSAGLKPNMILHTHGFNDETEVVFFDYSPYGLAFRKLLLEEWDGSNYPDFLRQAAKRLPPDANYCLWPGASPEDGDSPEMQGLWRRELERWGGEANLRDHWSRFRKLKHRFVNCNLLTEPETLLSHIAAAPHAAIWWSNAFATVYSAVHYTVEEKRAHYDRFIRALAGQAPQLLVYGSDHSNSSVNGMDAGTYRGLYEMEGGDPLKERRFYRHAIRF